MLKLKQTLGVAQELLTVNARIINSSTQTRKIIVLNPLDQLTV